jgi:trans-aconitate methyltransferase
MTGNAWDAGEYEDGHSFVYEYGTDVLDLLDPAPGERVLDVGCGTGHLTDEIRERGARPVGVDRSHEMLREARAAYPEVAFVRGDARAVPIRDGFDAVFSNATLHWVPAADQDAVLESIGGVLAPGGRFVAELGGTGNVARIVTAVERELRERGYEPSNTWYFPSVGEYAGRLEAADFEVRHARLFDRPTTLEGEDGLASWLDMFGDELLAAVPDAERPAVVDAVESRLEPELYRDGSWVADYRRLRVRAVLPGGDDAAGAE